VNRAEHELEFPWKSPPEAGTVQELRPGLYWLRMPLPFALNHINLWLLEDEIDGRGGFSAIDCGIADDPTRNAWEALFDRAFGERPLLRVIATHFHPDHLGLAEWLSRGGDRRRWTAPVWMTAAEYTIGRLLSSAGTAEAQPDGGAQCRFYEENGVTAEEAARRARARGPRRYARLVPAVPSTYRRIQDGESISIGPACSPRRFRVLTGFGHAPEHVSLMCDRDRILISGDMVLPTISTNISVYENEPEADPLARYLESLRRLSALPPDTLVLPSHGLPFFGLPARIRQLEQHHSERLDETLRACAFPRTADELLPVLFPRPLDEHQVGFAFGETLAHLHMLWRQGRVKRARANDGIYRFSRV